MVPLHPLRTAALALAVVLAAPAAGAATTVTVYSRDLGFVRESRTLEIAGDTVRIADVPERIDVASVLLAPATGKVTRLAYRYDLANGDALLERARGSRVRVALRDDRVVEGTLVTADGAWIVLRDDDGSLRDLSRSSVDDVRLPLLPGGLATRPSLEAVIAGARRGKSAAELSYLTGGLSWAAEHTVVRSGEKTATWGSEVTMENTTGRDFADVALRLVAGEPNRESPMPHPGMMRTMAMAAEKSADLAEETFSEYHLYRLDRPATLRDRETQKLTMLAPRPVAVTPRYLYRGQEGRGVRAQMEFRNAAGEGPGAPLPAGRVRVYEPDAAGELRFAGETRIGHTAEGEKVTLDVGQAFDLVGERRETSQRRISDREREFSVEVKLRNQKKSAATITVEESIGGEVEVTQQSHPSTRKDANTLRWDIPVPAGREVVLTYTARVRF
jgi:hypothetical protein